MIICSFSTKKKFQIPWSDRNRWTIWTELSDCLSIWQGPPPGINLGSTPPWGLRIPWWQIKIYSFKFPNLKMSSWCWWWHPGWNYGPKINLASHRGKSQRWSSNCPSREPRSVRWKFKWKKRINTWKLTSGTLNHHVRRFPTFQVPTGCLTFWKVTRRGAFFVCTMFMPLRWEYPVWTFHPPKSPKFGSFLRFLSQRKGLFT